MGNDIERFLAAIREFGERASDPDDEAGQATRAAHTLVMIATGGIWLADYPGSEEAFEQALRGEDATDYSEAELRVWLNHLVTERRMLASFVVTGLVRHIEERFEEFVEDNSKARKRAREDHAVQSARAVDPAEAARMADTINAMRHAMGLPESEDVTPEELPERIDEMYARYTKTPTLDDIKKQRALLNAWREVVVPILQGSVER
jgi:hypothetical protein